MNKILGVNFLILCFSLSSANISLAYEIIEVSPVVVQPCDLGSMNVQMYKMDRENQEKAMAIRALAKENQRLGRSEAILKQNADLEKVSQSMVTSQYVSKYDELINLTVVVDNMKEAEKAMVQKRGVIEEKHKILSNLEGEMLTMNKRLTSQPFSVQVGAPEIEIPYKDQEGKIQMLTQRLGEMDNRIIHFNDVIAQKDQEIAQLKDKLAKIVNQDMSKDETINKQSGQLDLLKSELENKITEVKSRDSSIQWLNKVMAASKKEAQYYKLTSQQDDLTIRQFKKELGEVKDDFTKHSKDYDQFQDTITSLKSQVSQLDTQLSQKQSQVDLLKLELKNKINDIKDQEVLTEQIQDLKAQLQDKADQIASLKSKIKEGHESKQEGDNLKQQLASQQDKLDQLKQQLDIKTSQADQMSLMVDEYQRKLESRNSAFNDQEGQIKKDHAQMEKQIDDLSARLQDKEDQILKIKKQMYDLKESTRSSQTKDLNGSLEQQKMTDAKVKEYQDKIAQLQALNASQIKELAALKDQLATGHTKIVVSGTPNRDAPNRDELVFLRQAYKQVSTDLELKNKLYHENKALADEYALEIQAASQGIPEAQGPVTECKGPDQTQE